MESNVYNNSLSRAWFYIFENLSDPLTIDLPLIRSPLPGLAILTAYWVFIRSLGPYLMKDREAFELKKILIGYNLFSVIFSAWLVYENTVPSFILGNYTLSCTSLDRSDTVNTPRVIRGFYFYFIAKIFELLDTVFFVLKKNDRQITFLHLFHHTSMFIIIWCSVKYIPGGPVILVNIMNSFVHVIMYLYYLLAALGPEWQKYLWWKKYLTTLQMIQFVTVGYFTTKMFFNGCEQPKWVSFLQVQYAIVMLYLFYGFYQNNYKKEQEKTNKKSISENGKKSL